MNKSLCIRLSCALALLCSSLATAQTVNVVADDANPGIGGTFAVTVSGAGFPETAGATLGLSWNPAVVSVTGVELAAGSPFETLAATAPWDLLTILGPLAGTQPSGSFAAITISFSAVGAGNAEIVLIDDQADLCWSDAATSLCIPANYAQADVVVGPQDGSGNENGNGDGDGGSSALDLLSLAALGLLAWRRRSGAG